MTTWQDKQMKIRWQQIISEFDITIENIEGKENFIADTLSRAGTYKGSASPASSDLSSLPNHTHTLPPPVVVHHIFISHPHLRPPPTNTNHSNSMPPRRTIVEWLRNQSTHLLLQPGHTIGHNPPTLIAAAAALGWETSSSKKGMQLNQIQTTVTSKIIICKGTGDTSSSNKGLPGMRDSRP